MKHINKKRENEPQSLIEYRSTPNANYNDCNKEDIRLALLKEQGYICAYCMQRISNKTNRNGQPLTTIEHYKAQSQEESLKLNYFNMLGVCRGNEGQPKRLQHCDSSRGNIPLTINPLDENVETFIKYSSSGEVFSEHEQMNRDLRAALNLNQKWLLEGRRTVMDLAIQNLQNKYKNKKGQSWSKSDLTKEINYWESRNASSQFHPFCQAAIYYLKKKLSRI